MFIKIVINGEEVKNPLAKALLNLLIVLLLTLFGVVFIVFVLPLIGITLLVSFSVVAFLVFSSFFVLVSLGFYQRRAKHGKRLEKSP